VWAVFFSRQHDDDDPELSITTHTGKKLDSHRRWPAVIDKNKIKKCVAISFYNNGFFNNSTYLKDGGMDEKPS
jgi:hypothetical protein